MGKRWYWDEEQRTRRGSENNAYSHHWQNKLFKKGANKGCGKIMPKEIPFARQLDVERNLFLCPDILDWSQGHYPVQCWTSDRSGAHRRRLTSRSSSRRLSLACWAMVFFSSNNCWVSRMYSWMMSTAHVSLQTSWSRFCGKCYCLSAGVFANNWTLNS